MKFLMGLMSAGMALCALPFSGCLATPSSDAGLRVAHLSPDAPNVDVVVDGTIALQNVPFQAVSDYLAVSAGTHRIQVTPTGQNDTVVIDAEVDLTAGTSYTVAARGLVGDETLAPTVLVDDLSGDAADAKVRFVHMSPDAPAVDVAVAGGDVLFANVAFTEASAYLNVDPGVVDLEVRLAGTDTVALTVPGVEFDANMNYTIFAIGLAGDETLAALPVVDAP